MDIALCIPELVAMIVEFAVGDARTSNSSTRNVRKDARALMLTSKIFSHFALNIIWEEVDGLQPLLSCVPSRFWVTRIEADARLSDQESKVPVLALRSDFGSRELENFEMYARRIKRLIVDLDNPKWFLKKTYVSLNAFQYLLEGHSHSGLSNLQEIDIHITDFSPRNVCIVPWLIQLSLKVINLTLQHSQAKGGVASMEPLFQAIYKICHKLQRLKLVDPNGTLELWDEKYQVLNIMRQTRLANFAISTPDLNYAILDTIGFNSYVTSLTIQLAPVMIESATFDRQIFPSLKNLSLRGCTLKGAQIFLTLLQNPRLVRLETITRISTVSQFATELPSYIAMISDLLPATTLSEIAFYSSGPATVRLDPLPYTSVYSQALRPLFKFVNMTCLNIYLPLDFSQLDDGLLEEIGIAWPQLEELKIEGSMGYSPTFSSLVNLSRQCQSLERMHFTFIDDFVPDWFEENDSRIAMLKHLSVGNAMIHNPEPAALALVKAFPLLKPEYIKPDYRLWDLTRNMTVYRSVRKRIL
jgi:hypothetical protein